MSHIEISLGNTKFIHGTHEADQAQGTDAKGNTVSSNDKNITTIDKTLNVFGKSLTFHLETKNRAVHALNKGTTTLPDRIKEVGSSIGKQFGNIKERISDGIQNIRERVNFAKLPQENQAYIKSLKIFDKILCDELRKNPVSDKNLLGDIRLQVALLQKEARKPGEEKLKPIKEKLTTLIDTHQNSKEVGFAQLAKKCVDNFPRNTDGDDWEIGKKEPGQSPVAAEAGDKTVGTKSWTNGIKPNTTPEKGMIGSSREKEIRDSIKEEIKAKKENLTKEDKDLMAKGAPNGAKPINLPEKIDQLTIDNDFIAGVASKELKDIMRELRKLREAQKAKGKSPNIQEVEDNLLKIQEALNLGVLTTEAYKGKPTQLVHTLLEKAKNLAILEVIALKTPEAAQTKIDKDLESPETTTPPPPQKNEGSTPTLGNLPPPPEEEDTPSPLPTEPSTSASKPDDAAATDVTSGEQKKSLEQEIKDIRKNLKHVEQQSSSKTYKNPIMDRVIQHSSEVIKKDTVDKLKEKDKDQEDKTKASYMAEKKRIQENQESSKAIKFVETIRGEDTVNKMLERAARKADGNVKNKWIPPKNLRPVVTPSVHEQRERRRSRHIDQ